MEYFRYLSTNIFSGKLLFTQCFLLLLSSTPMSVQGQKNYNLQWVLNNYIWMDFRHDSLLVGILPNANQTLDPGDYSTTICDSIGTLLFYTGGCYVLNTKNQIMKNGDSITGNWVLQNWCDNNDFPLKMNNTILPYPNNLEKYIIFNHDFVDPFGIGGPLPVPVHLYYHVVDMNLDNGLGAIVEKKQVVIEDTIGRGYLQAVRHANGSDWWVIDPKWNSNCYFIVPVTLNGVGTFHMECIGKIWDNNDWSGQTAFSPDATKFARIQGLNGLLIFDFDNLNGNLSNPIELDYSPNQDFERGITFSPNSRYLYITTQLQIFQVDLWAADIQSSLQIVGEIDETTIQAGQGYLGMSKLGPDGRIYIACSGSHKYLSVINKPNCEGKTCDFRQYAIQLSENNYSGLPNLPNFGIITSTYDCETMGLKAPQIKSNQEMLIYPNPTSGLTTLSIQTLQQGYWRLLDGTNKFVKSGEWKNAPNQIDLSKYNSGMYFFQLITNGGDIYTARIVLEKK